MGAAKTGGDVLFVLIGAVMVLAMHCGFALLEVGTVREKNQVNALVKILSDFAMSIIAYFFVGYAVAYGVDFFADAKTLVGKGAALENGGGFAAYGYDLVKFFFLATFAAAVPAIVSGGIAERAKFWPQACATLLLIAFFYPALEGMVWGTRLGLQDWMTATFGQPFHDFAGSVVVHAFGGWVALGAVLMLGNRRGRYRHNGTLVAIPPSNIPFLALGAWVLAVGWFGFNVMSAQTLDGVSGLVAINSLMAMVGGIVTSLMISRNDPGFVHNGALAGLVAVCAGSDVMHPLGALITGGLAGLLFVWAFNKCQIGWKIDDVLGVWPLHGLCGLTGGLLAGVFGQESLGGMGGVSLPAQAVGTLGGAAFGLLSGLLVYGALKMTVGIRLDAEEEHRGADLSLHQITAYPEADAPALR
ncbi:ammonium transporter [Azospirillum rugosum]|uniref:Amt family ammonium transporter n=1 Tax=Azospirillum rugosum TaxID=416170 RepID=A0ABS4SIP6_9PROT|nr:ammonium transporter [Azospirillum rugosum]MBP2292431.1 Amt family ammonium transporter [Azospirillum rugosum]MDQ0526190.1 Amt family ammonium transporter [Azospirillum rugosum]